MSVSRGMPIFGKKSAAKTSAFVRVGSLFAAIRRVEDRNCSMSFSGGTKFPTFCVSAEKYGGRNVSIEFSISVPSKSKRSVFGIVSLIKQNYTARNRA